MCSTALLRPAASTGRSWCRCRHPRARAILLVHMRKVPMAPDCQTRHHRARHAGFFRPDLANLVNEAASFAARGSKRLVDMEDFEKAKDKIYMGAERRSMVMPEDERVTTAYHEAGHTVVAYRLPKADPVHKVTIIPRGRALGITWMLPEHDRYGKDRERLLQDISVSPEGAREEAS